ncbi:MAG: NDP-hexose 2,3-dehydratase family protein [Oscillibacter sp.]|nr:NDP-hexose 2,3-dehydratase family protein [Oscillibacter sp.]MEA4993176.1 NDP-hexose 2,3-dehydratase family protein [Oscillibacter sp.]
MLSLLKSWRNSGVPLYTLDQLRAWINQRNQAVQVDIRKIPYEQETVWRYDEATGTIHNPGGSFFSIAGLKKADEDWGQPVLLQNEIGYLGILCKEFDNVLHFLMQAKIEPGNVNCVQISPTIQATKSNFTQRHGGNKPPYLDYFLNAEQHEIMVDQIQSEQSSRFWKKRNRNIIVRVEEEVEVLPSHRWMTLGQIKALMRYDNLVNMDTRTVLSCIPFCQMTPDAAQLAALEAQFADKALFRSVFCGDGENHFPEIYRCINNYKMFDETQYQFTFLMDLQHWRMRNGEFVCDRPWPFKVVFCDIAIEGREVKRWTQPLFEAVGIATFGLMLCEVDGVLKFVVRPHAEPGCFDTIELGPTVQCEAGESFADDSVSRLFADKLTRKSEVLFDVLLSEEGGRFYHEQNRNVLIRVSREELGTLPPDCFLVDFKTLNQLIQINNTVNIQLRNLLSVLEA